MRAAVKPAEDRRLEAAHASGGVSGEALYRAVERVVKSEGLGGSVLDYGAGKGRVLSLLEKLGPFHTLTGIDLMQRPPSLPSYVKWIVQDLNERCSLPDGSFDVVTSIEVFEHLENPRFAAREAFRLLRPGGRLFLSTPNNESWRSLLSLLVRGYFVAFGPLDYPAHVTALLRVDLDRLLSEAGFEKPAFHFTDEGGLPKFPSVTWQKLFAGLPKGKRFSDNLIAVARKPRD